MTDPAISLWDTSAQEDDRGAPLEGDARADVAIVGGGYTGLSAALHAAEAGLSAHVIEAERLVHGGSGRNVGLVNPGVWMPPADVRRSLGERYGPRFLEEFGAAPDTVFSLIERHQIRCEATRSGTIHAAHRPAAMAALRERHEVWREMGAPVRLLSADEVRELTGSAAFAGGLLDARAGTINPMGYCRGLARAATAAGARISTRSPARRLQRDGADWVIETPGGALRARVAILATNAYTDALWPGLASAFMQMHYFQLATPPLGARVQAILPERQGLWTTSKIMFSIRRDAEDRLIIGSMGRLEGDASRGLSQRWARRALARLFPDLGPVEFETGWHGQFAMTPDHLPRIYRLAENLYTPIGYNGRGITTGTVFGRALARLAAGADTESLPLPVTPGPDRVRLAPAMSRLYQSAFTANLIWKGLLAR